MNENHDNSDHSDEDVPQLSAETFAALQEFYNEQELRESKVSQILYTEQDKSNLQLPENWQLSQFWYDDDTINTLVKILAKSLTKDSKIALISCPTLYSKTKESFDNVKLFEYDQRFAIYGEDYIFYDYKSPLDVSRSLFNSFDVVIADPPFLSDECLTKTAVTIKFLTKNKVILCTGSTMCELASKLLNVKKTNFVPHHKNNLANEFCCYANYDIESYL